MSDDLLEELNNVLKTNMEKNEDKSSKLQSYFGTDVEKDDLFSVLIHDNIISRSFEENTNDNNDNHQIVDEYKKSIQFNNSNLNRETLTTENKVINKTGDAWLNSESTKNILARIISKDMSSNQVNKMLLAKPQLYTDPNQRLSDPIYSLLVEHFNIDTANEMRQIPSLDDFKYTVNEVLFLIDRGWIRPALDLTSRILLKMALIEIFRTPCRRRYYSTLFSRASFVNYSFLITAVLISLVISFVTKGFYAFSQQIVEDPYVYMLKNQLHCILGTDKGLFSYSLPRLDNLRVPSVSFQEIDFNSDGLFDKHNINLEFPMDINEKMYSFQIFVGFNFQFRRLALLQIQNFAYFEYSGSLDPANVSVVADLTLQQKAILNYKQYIPIQLPNIDPTNMDSVLDTYFNNPASLKLSNQYVMSSSGRNGNESFKFTMSININPTMIIYKPGFWYTTKWAWIQFVSIAIFALFLQQRIKEFLYINKHIFALSISDLECINKKIV